MKRNRIHIRIKDLESIVNSTRNIILEKKDEKEFDTYGEKLHGTVKQRPSPELSDQWYETRAKKFIQDYGTNIEDSWEETTAHRYCASLKASFGVEVDEKKLVDEIKKQLEERQDRFLEISPVSLKEIAQRLRIESLDEERYRAEPSENGYVSAAGPLVAEADDDDEFPRVSKKQKTTTPGTGISYGEFETQFTQSSHYDENSDDVLQYMGDNHGNETHSFGVWMRIFQECEMSVMYP